MEPSDVLSRVMELLQNSGAFARPDWCRVTLDEAAQAIGYGGTARAAENARRWLAEHRVTLLRVGKRWTVTVGDLRRALQAAEAAEKERDRRLKLLTVRSA